MDRPGFFLLKECDVHFSKEFLVDPSLLNKKGLRKGGGRVSVKASRKVSVSGSRKAEREIQ